eukprot:SAG11_NODE_37132_length_258_cov_0.811321_1_plen_63_part_01
MSSSVPLKRSRGAIVRLLFDGTFGPPHRGHVACGVAALAHVRAQCASAELVVHVSSSQYKSRA